MKKMVFHIGPYKTGTSHIQRFLAVNSDRLRECGVLYPANAHTERQKNGEVLSGNGLLLVNMLAQGRNNDARTALREATVEHLEDTVLFSSEMLSSISSESWKVLLEAGETLGRRVEILVYVRPPLDVVVSTVNQWVKRHGLATHPRDVIATQRLNLKSVAEWSAYKERLSELQNACGKERLKVRLYDRRAFVGGRIERDFLTALGIDDFEFFQFSDVSTNPSLTEEELHLLLLINSRYGSEDIATAVSDSMLLAKERGAECGTPVKIPVEVLEGAASEYEEDLHYLREEFGIVMPRCYSEDLPGPASALLVEKCAHAWAACLDGILLRYAPELIARERSI